MENEDLDVVAKITDNEIFLIKYNQLINNKVLCNHVKNISFENRFFSKGDKND